MFFMLILKEKKNIFEMKYTYLTKTYFFYAVEQNYTAHEGLSLIYRIFCLTTYFS